MKFVVTKYYSGYCTYEIEAKNEEEAYELAKLVPINEMELLSTLEEWKECNEIEVISGDTDQE